MQARGLKLGDDIDAVEIGSTSRLMQARGLKRFRRALSVIITLSRLMQARGLKPLCEYWKTNDCIVAPHAGAWIETEQRKQNN